MIDSSSIPITVEQFGGAQMLLDPALVPPGRATIARNMTYFANEASTRTGFQQAFNPSEAATSMFNWIGSLGNYLVWYRPDGALRLANISANPLTPSTLITGLTGYAAAHANAGARLYTALFNTANRGAQTGLVTSLQTGTFVTDPLFPGPITYVPATPTETASGVITAGLHRIGYVIGYRSGFSGRPSPDSGVGTPSYLTFQPISFTATGGHNCQITLNPPTWPVGAINVGIIMSPVTNPAQYIFVPGTITPVTGGSPGSVTITFSISDGDLLNNPAVNDVTDSLNFLTATTAGLAPFFPSQIFTYGNRMVYITTALDSVGNSFGVAYVSDIGAYQQIDPARSLVTLPGNLDIISGCSVQGTLYLMGPSGTFSTRDNGSDPVTWATPELVDSRRGTIAVRGVETAPGGTTVRSSIGMSAQVAYCWVADPSGLYLFRAFYEDLPISYLNTPEWKRINWNYAHTISIEDYAEERKVVVMAPLDSATAPSHLLSWNYTKGKQFNTVDFSIDTIGDGVGGLYAFSSMEIVQNTLANAATGVYKRKELWTGPTNGSVPFARNVSTVEANPYRDFSGGIDWQYRLAFFSPENRQHILKHLGDHLRLRGNGAITIKDFAQDADIPLNTQAIQLVLKPGADHFHMCEVISEGAAVDLSANAADVYMILSYQRHYYVPYLEHF